MRTFSSWLKKWLCLGKMKTTQQGEENIEGRNYSLLSTSMWGLCKGQGPAAPRTMRFIRKPSGSLGSLMNVSSSLIYQDRSSALSWGCMWRELWMEAEEPERGWSHTSEAMLEELGPVWPRYDIWEMDRDMREKICRSLWWIVCGMML